MNGLGTELLLDLIRMVFGIFIFYGYVAHDSADGTRRFL